MEKQQRCSMKTVNGAICDGKSNNLKSNKKGRDLLAALLIDLKLFLRDYFFFLPCFFLLPPFFFAAFFAGAFFPRDPPPPFLLALFSLGSRLFLCRRFFLAVFSPQVSF